MEVIEVKGRCSQQDVYTEAANQRASMVCLPVPPLPLEIALKARLKIKALRTIEADHSPHSHTPGNPNHHCLRHRASSMFIHIQTGWPKLAGGS
jgi:hypothetical protein